MIWLFLAGALIVSGAIALSIDWSTPLTPFSVLQMFALWFTSRTAVQFIRRRWEIRKGLHQWPNPHGRYYDEWYRLPSPHEDYYVWLARKMNWREPWASWAKMEQELERSESQ